LELKLDKNIHIHALVVDENGQTLTILKDVIESKSFVLVEARKKSEGLLKLGKQPFDIMIIDIDTPDNEGVSYIQRVRKNGFVGPVLLLTENNEAYLKDISLLEPITLLEKPYPLGIFKSILNQVLGQIDKTENSSDFPLRGLQVMVVDDQPINREVLKSHVEEMGAENIFEAGDGIQGLEIVEQKHLDLLFLDYLMPKMDGAEFISKLRDQYNKSELPVIMISGQEDMTKIPYLVEKGINDYLVRPFDLESLKGKVQKVVTRAFVKKGSIRSMEGVLFQVKDFLRSLIFYRKIIGCRETVSISGRDLDHRQKAIFTFHSGGKFIIEQRDPNHNEQGSSSTTVFLQTQKLDSTFKDLKKAQLPITKIFGPDSPDGMTYLKILDPDENTILIGER